VTAPPAEPTPVVLDASAVLALLTEEPGADEVEALLDGSAMSTVNVSEVLQRSMQHGVETEGLEDDLQGLGVELHPFDVAQARATAELWELASNGGLSLGDRASPWASRSEPWPSRPIDAGPPSISASRSE